MFRKSWRVVFACGGVAVLLGTTGASADSLLDRARDAVRDAGQKIEDAAKEAGRSASDFLADNPDLNRDILDFGRKIGLPGFDQEKPAAGAGLAIFPTRGQPGSRVILTVSGLPGKVPVTIGVGPPRSRYEVIGKTTTSERGGFETDVGVPDWAEAADRLVFTVESEDGRIRLVSEHFTVVAVAGASPDETIVVTGTLSNEGASCPALRGDDGALYTLADPEAGGFVPGDRVHVEGKVAEVSTCMQGVTITDARITRPGG